MLCGIMKRCEKQNISSRKLNDGDKEQRKTSIIIYQEQRDHVGKLLKELNLFSNNIAECKSNQKNLFKTTSNLMPHKG